MVVRSLIKARTNQSWLNHVLYLLDGDAVAGVLVCLVAGLASLTIAKTLTMPLKIATFVTVI